MAFFDAFIIFGWLRLLQGLKGLFFRIVSFWSVVPRVKSFPADRVSDFGDFFAQANINQRLCYTNDKLKRKQMKMIFSHLMLAFSLRAKIIRFING